LEIDDWALGIGDCRLPPIVDCRRLSIAADCRLPPIVDCRRLSIAANRQ
jgi:hypothetical protein